MSFAQSPALDLRDGDRVVFVGGTFIERMQQFGDLELLLTVAHPEKHITFRNLGWSGDTVWGESRALFGSPVDGLSRLINDVKAAEPTLLVVCYGSNEAHAGEAGREQFIEGLNHLLDQLADTHARVVLLSPYAYRPGPPGVPSPAAYNANLKTYCHAISELAAKRSAPYFSLFDLLDVLQAQTNGKSEAPVTDNGVHLTGTGYRLAAVEIAKRLGVEVPRLDLAAADERLARLRAAIQFKNELYFHRYRPQNETYLFLFRKHEQGNNAVEIPQFDPLVEEQEKLIAELKQSANRLTEKQSPAKQE
ncbi:MAG: SGNH/GDSL hydrolase family protein [Pirellulaceae bacterium]